MSDSSSSPGPAGPADPAGPDLAALIAAEVPRALAALRQGRPSWRSVELQLGKVLGLGVAASVFFRPGGLSPSGTASAGLVVYIVHQLAERLEAHT